MKQKYHKNTKICLHFCLVTHITLKKRKSVIYSVVALEYLAGAQQCAVPPSVVLAQIPTIFLSHSRACYSL